MENYSKESECEVLGAALGNETCMESLLSTLGAEDFYLRDTRIIFNTIKALYDKGAPINVTSVNNYLKETGEIREVGDNTVGNFARSVIAYSNHDYHLKTVKNKSNLRKIKEIVRTLYQKLDTTSDDADAVIESVKDEISKIEVDSAGPKEFKHAKDVISEKVQNIQDLASGKIVAEGIKTKFVALDNITQGFQKGDLIILAARPSMGKTALALNFAVDAAKLNEGQAVVFFSLEMPAEQLVTRILSSESKVSGEKLRTGKGITKTEMAQITSTADKLKKLNIYIDDTSSITLPLLQTKVRRLASQVDIGLVIVDYLQIMSSHGNPNQNREGQISAISRGFKILARDLKFPLISLAQLSRKVESREIKKPIMSDIRESGAIEQDADLIMFLYRESYYKSKEEGEAEPAGTVAELILAKHRNGPTGSVKLAFATKLGTFENKND